MIQLKYTRKYDENTGEPWGVGVEQNILRCDYTGTQLDELPSEDLPYPSYSIDYGSQDPCLGLGSDPESRLWDEYPIGMGRFLLDNGKYRIRSDYEGRAYEEFTEYLHKEDSYPKSFGSYLRMIRSRTALRLIEEEIVPLHEINGFEYCVEDWTEEKGIEI
jgi:hypothetical protein